MKKLFNQSLLLLLTLSLFSCTGPTPKADQSGSDTAQKMALEIDGNNKTTDPAPLISPAFSSAHFMLGYLSEKDDIQFTLSTYMQDLKPGTYQVYECTSAAECDDKVPDNNQIALFGPYPKDPMPPINLSRTAYHAPKLGLTPLMLVITSVADEQQAGNPFKTKRVKGQFSGTLACVERQQDNNWLIVGKTTQVNGTFDVLCSMR